MVKRLPETKSAIKKGSATIKKNAAAVKKSSKKEKSENLSNGFDKTDEDIVTPDIKGPSENLDHALEATAEQEPSRKRKPVSEEKVVTKTRSKKQKTHIQVPEISSVVGKVFVIGDNSVGQLGFDSNEVYEKKKPTLLEIPDSIVDIAAGGMHSVCLTQSGEVITFGCNDEGALGRETDEDSMYLPRKVELDERMVRISAGDSHTAALSESGQVYIWGNFRNNNGAMGLVRPDAKQDMPFKILNGTKIVKISSGSDHLSCLSNEGIVYTSGNAESGQLGRISERDSAGGGRRGIGHLLNPASVSILRSDKCHDVWTGLSSTFLKMNNGSIYAFGLNNWGQLGCNPDQTVVWKPKRVTSFSKKSWSEINGGQHHTLALDNKGLVYSLGRPEYGRLGLGEDADVTSEPTEISSLGDKNCTNISTGNCVSFALEENGSVYSWGMGTNHQLGHGNDSDQDTPKLVEGTFLDSWKAIKVVGGGQHTLILAHPRNSSEKKK